MSMINIATPQLMALIMFGTYILLGNELSLRTVFAVITLIQLLRISIRIMPYAIYLGVGCAVGCNRLNTFFNAKMQSDMIYIDYNYKNDRNDKNDDDDDTGDKYVVYMKDASFIWPKGRQIDDKKDKKKKKKNKKKEEEKENEKMRELLPSVAIENNKDYEFLLDKITMKLERGKLYALVGSVGSGKSSLIYAILHEMQMTNGVLMVNNSMEDTKECIGYVSQSAFIVNDTVRENILWGLPYNEKFYEDVLEASSLSHDLSILANGDLTEIGERGINLSGFYNLHNVANFK